MRGAGVVPGQSPERGINRLRGDEMSGLPTNQTQLEGQRLLQLRVLCFRFLQDGDVGVGVFPEGEEIFITAASPLGLLQENNVKIEVTAQNTETLSIRRQVK